MGFFENLRDDVHNLSYWFPKIKDCGIRVPQTFVKSVPEEILHCFFMERPNDMEDIFNWVKNELMPEIPKELRGLIFIKNGTFSNKFDFRTCAVRCSALDITNSIIEINYASLLYGAGGNAEVVIRERLPFNEQIIPTIYHGMPFQNEYRVFYDFDTRKALYVVNYWDWDYCHEQISRNLTDKYIYEAMYGRLQEHFEERKDEVLKLVEEHMKDVDMQGIWSVDIYENVLTGDFWLIDMATGVRSAYWDAEKVEAALHGGE